MKNYFKLIDNSGRTQFFFFIADSKTETRRAYNEALTAKHRDGGTLSVWKSPTASGPWQKVPVIGWESDEVHGSELRDLARTLLAEDDNSAPGVWELSMVGIH